MIDKDRLSDSLSDEAQKRQGLHKKVAGITEMQKESSSNDGMTGKHCNNSHYMKPIMSQDGVQKYEKLRWKQGNVEIKTNLLKQHDKPLRECQS